MADSDPNQTPKQVHQTIIYIKIIGLSMLNQFEYVQVRHIKEISC